jgi:protein ImuA
MSVTKKDIITALQREILPLQGFKPPSNHRADVGIGPIADAFPNAVFPTGAIHEVLSAGTQNAAAACGFVAALVARLMVNGGACVWIGSAQKIFPPGLKTFGIEPDRVIFMNFRKEQQALWAMEEALKCEGLAAVIGEIRAISFIASRRLQLVVEQSRVTGFLLRHDPNNINPIASVARWHITPLVSELEPGMPGIGHPRWNIELSRVRNGRPGVWQMEWQAGLFQSISQPVSALPVENRRKTG